MAAILQPSRNFENREKLVKVQSLLLYLSTHLLLFVSLWLRKASEFEAYLWYTNSQKFIKSRWRPFCDQGKILKSEKKLSKLDVFSFIRALICFCMSPGLRNGSESEAYPRCDDYGRLWASMDDDERRRQMDILTTERDFL